MTDDAMRPTPIVETPTSKFRFVADSSLNLGRGIRYLWATPIAGGPLTLLMLPPSLNLSPPESAHTQQAGITPAR